DERHREVQQAVFRRRGEQRNDVRVLEPRRELNLTVEALGAQASRDVGRQDFDDDLASERDVVDKKDARHAAAAQLPLDAISVTQAGLEPVVELGHFSSVECAAIEYAAMLVWQP